MSSTNFPPELIPLEARRLELEAKKLEEEIASLAAARSKLKAEAKTAAINARGHVRREQEQLADPDLARIYTFHGSVNPHSAEHARAHLDHWSRRDPGQPITVIFNSPGGGVFEGFSLYDTIQGLRRKGHHITTKGTGMAASMGGILLQSGDERVMDERSWLLIHEISTMIGGKSSEIEDTMKFLEKLQGQALSILAERSTLSERQIARRWKKTDWWLSAQEALELGFVDRVE